MPAIRWQREPREIGWRAVWARSRAAARAGGSVGLRSPGRARRGRRAGARHRPDPGRALDARRRGRGAARRHRPGQHARAASVGNCRVEPAGRTTPGRRLRGCRRSTSSRSRRTEAVLEADENSAAADARPGLEASRAVRRNWLFLALLVSVGVNCGLLGMGIMRHRMLAAAMRGRAPSAIGHRRSRRSRRAPPAAMARASPIASELAGEERERFLRAAAPARGAGARRPATDRRSAPRAAPRAHFARPRSRPGRSAAGRDRQRAGRPGPGPGRERLRGPRAARRRRRSASTCDSSSASAAPFAGGRRPRSPRCGSWRHAAPLRRPWMRGPGLARPAPDDRGPGGRDPPRSLAGGPTARALSRLATRRGGGA